MGSQEARTIAEFLIAEFEREMQTTLRVIAAVPNDRLDYRPDAKSKSGLGLGQLSAYLRAMGGKIPAIYGSTADTR